MANQIINLAEKTVASLQRDGIRATAGKGKKYIRDHIRCGENRVDSFTDVLFINGCALPHPMRYRVSHQREQLLMANLTSNEVYYEDVRPEMANLARVFIFFRCPYTDAVGQLIAQAKKYHKTVLFDIDDLVFDRAYTDGVRYVRQMKEADRKLYDDGVDRIGETLRRCEIATTTTEALAGELRKYVGTVYVNRNVASEKMVMLSDQALREMADRQAEKARGGFLKKFRGKCPGRGHAWLKKRPGQVSVGYFSGSVTHNDDFRMILPAVVRIMKENGNVHLYLAGELDIPAELHPFRGRVHSVGFMDWKELPFVLAQMDINLAPLEDTAFNRAKSENKWTEASLVKVVTIASDTGAFRHMIRNGETGVLCPNTEEDWYRGLSRLVRDRGLRKRIAKAARNDVLKNCITEETSYAYGEFIKSVMTPNVMFHIPTAGLNGGNLVAQRHALALQKTGADVFFLNDGGEEITKFACLHTEFPVIRSRTVKILGSVETAVATLYTTVEFVQNYPNIRDRVYLVQGMETAFAPAGSPGRITASKSYMPLGNIRFITVSVWCRKWLREKYHVEADYIPNGIDCALFKPAARNFDGTVRILIVGDSEDPNKNTDESFRIAGLLNPGKYEIWHVSNRGKPKNRYRTDRFFRGVPNEDMPRIYRRCHILLISSIMESFSYPPLEMLATGGFVVARRNEGNAEYLKQEENCLFYDPGELRSAVKAIERIVSDSRLRDRLSGNGVRLARERDWSAIDETIQNTYPHGRRS